MNQEPPVGKRMQSELEELRSRLEEAQETLRAIRSGELDAVVVQGPKGEQIYTLKGAEEPYRMMVETMTEGALTISPDGIILYCNARFAELVKTTLERTIGSALKRFIAPDAQRAVESLLASDGATVSRREIDLLAVDGERLPVHISCRALRRERLEAIAAVVTDLSEVTRLQEMDRLKSMFIASMSHELRTPLNIIIGFTGILLQGMVGELNAEQRKQLGYVKDAGAHLLELVNDVIDVSKIEAGKVQLSRESFDLAELTKEVADSFAVEVAGKGLELTVSAPEVLRVESDRRRVKQILVNLIGNSIKFTDQGCIAATLTAHGGKAEIAVRDTGIGIRQEDLGKLFTAFGKIVTERKEQEGSGLGLYLSQKLARLLGGRITAESEFGAGSTFTFCFPFNRE